MITNQNIKVLIRSRPLLTFENEPAWQVSNGNTIQILQSKSVQQKLDKNKRKRQSQLSDQFRDLRYQFQKVFDDAVTSQKIYKQQCKQMVVQALQKTKNLTLMCYGQTCSGKTFTILGEQKYPGLMPCLLRDLIIYSSKFKNQKCQISMSYFQIYNQAIYDLLVDGNRMNKYNNVSPKLKLTDNKKWGWQVAGLKKQIVFNLEDCIKIIQKGQKSRAYASKQNHQRSSRSHTIMRIQIEKQDAKFNKKKQIINIVDLAGSQRLSEFSKNPKETAYINKSLFQLSNVISKLSANDSQAHIPYRDSKLTKLLECSLSSQSNCAIIFCISPSIQSFKETLSTLRLAKKAKNIVIEPDQNLIVQNFSPLEKQLYQTKIKLSKKTRQCQDLTFRLDFLSNQLQHLERQFQQTQSRKNFNLQLTILLDHQNFTLTDLQQNKIKLNQSCYAQIDQLKYNFQNKIQQIYENYAAQITQFYLNKIDPQSQFQIKFNQVCFIDLIFNNQSINQFKKQSLQRIKEQLKNQLKQNLSVFSNLNNQKNSEYIKRQNLISLIQIYQKKLNLNSKSSQNKKYIENKSNFKNIIPNLNFTSKSFFQHTLKEKAFEFQNSSCLIQQIDSRMTHIKDKQGFSGNTLYSWGCSKDGRIFKGDQIFPGIIQLNNQNYGLIKSITTSYNHSILLNDKGKIYGWGKNQHHQISPKDALIHSLPKQISLHQKIKRVATGWAHSLALSQQGNVYSWGYGKDGQLGHGVYQDVNVPKIISKKIKGINIYCGHSHSAILDEFGQLYTFGLNQDYRLLRKNDHKPTNQPHKIALKNIKKASLGVNHSAIITCSGHTFCGGIGSSGQFGQQLTLNVGGCQYLQVQNKKYLEGTKKYEKICPLIEVQFQFLNYQQQIQDVKCGQNSTYFLTNFGNLYFCGKGVNKNQQTDHKIIKILDNVSHFSIGNKHGFAFTMNQNKIYGWGFNMYNQLGNNKQKDLIQPQVISTLSNLDIKNIQCGFIHSIGLAK